MQQKVTLQLLPHQLANEADVISAISKATVGSLRAGYRTSIAAVHMGLSVPQHHVRADRRQ